MRNNAAPLRIIFFIAVATCVIFLPGCPSRKSKAVALSTTNFDKIVLGNKGPVLVDFWAEWCGPCKKMEPVIRELADEFDGRALIAQVNVDDNPEIARHYDIQGIPALLIFKDGQLKHRLVGVQDKYHLQNLLVVTQ